MQKNIYEQRSLTKLILIFGIPSILALMIEMMTGIIDTAFAGNLPKIGDSALAAMALISPILMIFTALQTLFAMSTGILIAKYLNNKEKQNQSYITGITMSIIIAIITSFICYFMLINILSVLGASGEIFDLAYKYLKIQLISNIFSSIGYTLTCCIRAFGYPKIEVMIITSAVIINIIFNYIMAFQLKMGITGLALGTLISEIVCSLIAILFLISKKLWINKQVISIKNFINSTWELFKIGIAQTVIQILGGCTGFVINARLLTLGSMNYIAAWSIVGRIYTFILMPIVGITQGVQNIIAYFNGNKQPEKIKKIAHRTMIMCTIYGFITLLLMISFGHHFIMFFGGNHEIVTIAQKALFIVVLGFPAIGILYTEMTILQVTEHEVSSILLILSRQVFFLIPLIYIIPALASIINISPIIALFFCMPLSDILSVIFSKIVKKYLSLKTKKEVYI
ncbi:MAG: MATE family efflux transporter [Bacilli bacterium]